MPAIAMSVAYDSHSAFPTDAARERRYDPLRAVSRAADVTVDYLLKQRFLTRSREERLEIVRIGKPRPRFPSLQSADKDGGARGTAVFNPALFDEVEWLTGCDVRQALFCWSCLLFKFASDCWNNTGVQDFSDLRQQIRAHEKSVSHIQSTLDLKLYRQRDDGDEDNVVSQDVLRKNREMAMRIIDALCALATERRGKHSVDAAGCTDNLRLIRDYDIVKTDVIDETVQLLHASPRVLDDMVDSITDVMKASIRTELLRSAHVSLILSNHSSQEECSRISAVLRYIKDDRACERFVEFIAGENKTCMSICEHIDRIVGEYEISHTLLAYSLDGSVFRDASIFSRCFERARGAGDLLKSCRQHQHVGYFPCHFHEPEHVMCQSLSTYEECEFFFQQLAALRSLFRKGPRWRERLMKNTAAAREPGESNLSGFDSGEKSLKFFEVVKQYRKEIVAVFEQILETEGEDIAEGELSEVLGLHVFLKHFRTFFLLETVTNFFFITLSLVKTLHCGYKSEQYPSLLLDAAVNEKCWEEILETAWHCGYKSEQNPSLLFGVCFSSSLATDKASWDWEKYFESVRERYEVAEKPIQQESAKEMMRKHFYRELFSNIKRDIANQIRGRFLPSDKLGLFSISNLKRKGEVLNSSYVEQLASVYGNCFSYESLQDEMASLKENTEILNSESVHQLMELLSKQSLKYSCPNVYKVVELVLTLPCSSPNVRKEGPTKLEVLSAWCDRADEQKNVGDASLMCIESDIFEEIKKRYSFHEEVLLRFQERNKILQLL